MNRFISSIKPLLSSVLCLLSFISNAQWQHYGGDAGGTRYSVLTQVNKKNITGLKPAWTFHTGELELYKGTNVLSKAAFEATPIVYNNTLFFSTPTCRVFAINASSGKQTWLFDPHVDLKKDRSEMASRGVSLWTGKNNKDTRIFIGTIDGRLIALNAKDGAPVSSFGKNGTIDLNEGYGSGHQVTSPPAIIGDLVITGSSLGDNQRSDYPKGIVRAFNVISGKQVWEWNPLAYDSANHSGAANAWSIISVDEKRGLVFIPTSSASPDYYGGNRKGAGLYANSIVALTASTGKMVWHFQVVHHDLWDYDIAAQPMLIDIKKQNTPSVPAVAVGTKMGHIFVLHRETGKPIFPVEERPVPASDLEGESAAPTQPFPVLPEPLGIQRLSVSDAWGPTPELKKNAEERIKRYLNKGPFTPPTLQGTLVTPGNVGGIHWGGMCYDPLSNTLFTNINRIVPVIRMFEREKLKQAESEDQELLRKETGWQEGTPYVLKRDYLFTEHDGELLMQTAPPWGTLDAIDLATGKRKWEVPLGLMMDTIKYPDARKWGSINFGGAIATAGGLIFVAAARDTFFRAFDSNTGDLLWEYPLPASAQATPMTYSVNGKQFIVIAAGGHGKLMTRQGDAVVAFTLGDQ